MNRAAFFLLTILATTRAFAQVDCNQGLEPIDVKTGSRIAAMDFVREVAANEVAFSKALAQSTKVPDRYWLPSTIGADENVRADDSDVHVRGKVKYSGCAPR